MDDAIRGGKTRTGNVVHGRVQRRPRQPGVSGEKVRWPTLLPHWQAQALAMQQQFAVSERWPGERILAQQLLQLETVIRHAARTVPFYRQRLRGLAELETGALTLDRLVDLPLMRRQDIQDHRADLRSREVPTEHGKSFPVRSSGSTGRPIEVLGTELTSMYGLAFTLRGHLWHKRDVMKSNVDIRTAIKPGQVSHSRWSLVPNSGLSMRLDINLPIAELLEQYLKRDPEYLQTHPYTLKGLIELSVKIGVRPKNLREVRTFGEALEPDIRDLARRHWGVPVTDNYSAMELGTIAQQCPESENLHVQAEGILLEVLNEDGGACRRGEVGRVVVSTLQNYASPLLRYELGDYAEMGAPCQCGRGLPVLRRIIGRQRNLLRLPDGSQIFPEGWREFSRLAPIRQFQLVQTSLQHIAVNLVTERRVTDMEEESVRRYLRDKFSYDFEITFHYHDIIERSANGKFEEFRSDVADAGREQ